MKYENCFGAAAKVREKLDASVGHLRQHVNPNTLHKNPAFSNVVVVSDPVKTIYVGGQDAVDGLAHPDFLVEIDVIAVVPQQHA